MTNPDGKTVSYSYDSLGRRRTMTDPDGGLFTYSYDQAGRPGGHRVDIELVRRRSWLAEHRAQPGGAVLLDMQEMGVQGSAEVVAIDCWPHLEKGEGRLVTGLFRHTGAWVYDLTLEAESKPIGVTGTHPFWSMDRGGWVAAAELRMGETLKTLTGATAVERISRRPESETVYNRNNQRRG